MVEKAKDNEKGSGALVPFEAKLTHFTFMAEEDVADMFAERILNAPSFEAAMIPVETLGLKELSGIECEFLGCHGMRGTVDGEPSIYAVIQLVRLDTGEVLTATCGGKNVLALLNRAIGEDKFPFKGKVWETMSQSNPKNKPLYIVPADHF